MSKEVNGSITIDQFTTEQGETVEQLTIAYSVLGDYNSNKTNVVWAIHPFTANLDVEAWMPGIVGPDCILDTHKYCIICANVPGSPYGSSCPLDTNPKTMEKYYYDFPVFTTRDVIDAFEYLRVYLGVSKIKILVGASMGGQLVYQWLVSYPDAMQNAIVIAADAKISTWAIALHSVQQSIIELDDSWGERRDDAGSKGLIVARQMGVISYRSHQIFQISQESKSVVSNAADEKGISDSFENVQSYLKYQGERFLVRFNTFSYLALVTMMNYHDVSKGYDNIAQALARITANVLLVGIDSDMLFSTEVITHTQTLIKNSMYKEISSIYGHDALFIEVKQLEDIIHEFFVSIGEEV